MPDPEEEEIEFKTPLYVTGQKWDHMPAPFNARDAHVLLQHHVDRMYSMLIDDGTAMPFVIFIAEDRWTGILFHPDAFMGSEECRTEMLKVIRMMAHQQPTIGVAFGSSIRLTTFDGMPSLQQVQDADHSEEGIFVVAEWIGKKPQSRIRRIQRDQSGEVISYSEMIDKDGDLAETILHNSFLCDLMGQQKGEGR